MTISMKIMFFVIAVVSMVCFAIASILMANGDGWASFGLFVLAFGFISAGFVMKRKVLRNHAM